MKGPLGFILEGLVDLVFPERCVLCGAGRGEKPWCPSGCRATGLRLRDVPHLCLPCLREMAVSDSRDATGPHGLKVAAALPTTGDLVEVVGQWKYHGLRGLAWPLADLALAKLPCPGQGSVLVPLPLHSRRRRRRGFNQARMLADLLGAAWDIPVAAHALIRHRATGQQAQLTDERARDQNVRGAFAAGTGWAGLGDRGEIWLVDDLVTTGATAQAAAEVLVRAGMPPAGIYCLGAAQTALQASG